MPELPPEPNTPPDSPSASGSGLASTQAAEPTDLAKEVHDIAFAAEIIEGGEVTERQLASTITDWTLHGTTTLADHITRAGLVSDKTRVDIETRATQRLRQAASNKTSDQSGNGTHRQSAAHTTLELLDESGRVARLLGIRIGTSAVSSGQQREHATRYQIIRKLGQGGLGTVWLARDMKMQRLVALKEIKNASKRNDAAVRRFYREAEITGRLEHPGIVPVYQLGEDTSTGDAFYAMRFIGKHTLQDSITEYHERREEGDHDPMLLRRLLTAFVNVCQAIGHAHSRKVIHRDLKPENVAIDSFGQVIVIDWGLAKVLDDGASVEGLDSGMLESSDGERTLAGQVLGSPLYMAPEQAAGRVDEIDESTDIYGLGAILFAILTGNAPHELSRQATGSTTTRGLISAITSKPTPHASAIVEGIDPALDAICAKAMAKRRYARYGSTTDLADDVQRWMAGEPVSAYQERPLQRIGRWIQHHQRLSQLIAATVIIAMVTVLTLSIAARQNRVAAQQARFEEMKSDQREVEVQLVAAGDDLSGDVRFMSTLPPIQGIIDARSSVQESGVKESGMPDSDLQDSEDESVWRARLETIYEGLLRANPDYLAVSYIGASNQRANEITRVERPAKAPGYIRRVPLSRLAELEKTSRIDAVMNLEPGDVNVALESLSPKHTVNKPGRLVAAIPVFDETSGEPFGLVTLEVDLTERLETILSGLDNRLDDVYVTDASGKVLVRSTPDSGVDTVQQTLNVVDVRRDLRPFFTDESRIPMYSDGSSVVVHRVQLDPSQPASDLCIVHILQSSAE